MKLICTKDITLINDGIGNIAEDKDFNLDPIVAELAPIESKNKSKSTHVKGHKRKKSKRKMLNKSVMNVDGFNHRKHFLYSQAKKNPFNKFLEKSDLIEIAIRAPQISNEEEVQLITLLYEHLSTPTIETVGLYKLLIYYEQIQTFEMLLHRRETLLPKQMSRKVSSDGLDPMITLGRKDDDNIYDLDEIISDCFAYSITLNKMHIAFYLFKKYKEDVYGNKMLCIKAIFDSFKNEDKRTSHVIYLEERLFILEKFMKHIEYKMGLEYLILVHNEVLSKPEDNMLVYTANPLKIIVILLNIAINISFKHQNLKFKAQKLRASLCDIANSLIDNCETMNEVEDMLRDKTYAGTEVINMIAFLDIIEILQNPMIDSIISNLYYGPYEREMFFK